MTLAITYDTGALIAAARGDARIWSLHESAVAAGLMPTVPAGVLAQAWRGGPQDRISRLLKACSIETLGEARARSTGALCGRAGTTDIVDSSVVLGAGIRGDVIVTSDRADMQALSEALGIQVQIIDI